MQTRASTVAATAGQWGGTAKTVAMGAAGTALWGSLAFYFVVGANGSDAVAESDVAAQNLFFRMEIAESELVDGCSLNSGTACDGTAWIILARHPKQLDAPQIPTALKEAVPEPLWRSVTERTDLTNKTCGAVIAKDVPAWLAALPKGEGTTVARIPETLAACQAMADPTRAHETFWFMSGPAVVAEMRCSVPGTQMDPSCELATFPEHGTYQVSFSRLPAVNAQAIATQSPDMMAILEANLPDGMAGNVALDLMTSPVSYDVDTTTAMDRLNGISG